MRLFLAYSFNDVFLQKIEIISNCLKDELLNRGAKINFVETSSVHITIKFLEDEKPETIINSITKNGFNFSLDKEEFYISSLTAFPNKKEPKILVLPIEDNKKLLIRNFEVLENILEKSGINRELRDFKPHITVARIKYPYNIAFNNFKYWGILPGIKEDKLSFRVSKLKLFQSILTPTKPIYKEIYEF